MKTKFCSLILFAFFCAAMQAQSITSVAPNNGNAGCQVTITGSGFSTTATENQVYFGNSKANVISVNSTGTELEVNTPTNPSYPFDINVFNASNNQWITSDVRFAFTYKARVNPTSRNFGDQYQTSTAETQFFTSNVRRRSLGDIKGKKALVTDFNGDNELDIYLQTSDFGGFPNSYQDPYGKHSVLMNQNDVFTIASQGNGGFSVKESGSSGWENLAIKQSGILSVDLNNDGKKEIIVYGARLYVASGAKNSYYTPSFAILESSTTQSSSASFSLTQNSNEPQNIFTITSDGGWDFPADQMTPLNNTYSYEPNLSNVTGNTPHIEHSGDKLLYQTCVLAMESVDIDKDGDMDLVALLSWPLLREAQGTSNPTNRAQIYIFKNTTSQGSSTFQFNNSTYKTGSSSTTLAIPGYRGLNSLWGYSNFSDWGNFLGPDEVIELQNSSFTEYDIQKWISDLKVSDLDDDGDFDIIVKGISDFAPYTLTRLDTTITSGTSFGGSSEAMDWLYLGGINKRSGLQAASGPGNGFLSFFENTTTGSNLSFTETTVDAAVSNNNKFDFGGIDVCDIDNDGDKDIVIAAPDNSSDSTANPNINIYLQSAGSFSQPVVLSAPNASTTPTTSQHMDNQGGTISRLKCVDLNGDNLMDILITGTNIKGLFSYMRLPDQTTISNASFDIQNFVTTGSTSPTFGAPFDVTIADFSNDGKVDLIVQGSDYSSNNDAPTLTYIKNNNGDPAILTNISLGIFTKCTNDESPSQSFTIGGINISHAKNHKITASVNSDFEICLDPNANNWGASLLLSPDQYNDIAATELFIRAKSNVTPPVFTGVLTLSSQEAETVTFALNGELDLPVGGAVSPAIQFVNTSNTSTTPPTTSPVATTSPVMITLTESFGDIQWQKSTDNSTWADITGETSDSYTLPYSEIDNEGEVYLRAKLMRCTESAYSETAVILENLGAPAPPILEGSNGQSIAGTFDNGLTTKLEIYADGVLIASCDDFVTVCAGWTITNGTFTYTPNSGFSSGVEITARAYNSTVSSIPSTAITVDATAPSLPIIEPSNGTIVTGTAEANSSVTITYNSTTVTVLADAAGNYVYYPQTPISDGSSITVTATDAVGNVSNSASQNVDAVSPTITPDVTDANGLAQMSLLTLSGNTESGATVVLTLDDGTEYQTIADSDGDFTVTFSPALTEGDNVYVTATDAAGNTSSMVTFVADGTAPSEPTVNPSNGSVISGTGEANSTVTFTFTVNGTQYSETASVDGSGNYSYTPSVTIPNNTVVSVTNIDGVGNESDPEDITIDTVAPLITSIEDANGDAISNTSVVEGSTEPNTAITVTIGGTVYSGTSDANGDYSIDISGANLSDGDSYSLIATDAAGNISTETVTVDATPPASPTVIEIGGYVGKTFSGTAEPNSTVTVSIIGTQLSWTTMADVNGDYSVSITVDGGDYHDDQLSITSTDAVGNASTPTTTTLHNQTVALSASVVYPAYNNLQNVNVAGQSLDGSTDPNLTVTATLPDGTEITTVADASGDFSFDLSSYSLNENDNIAVSSVNQYGNESNETWVVDATAPLASIYATDGTSFDGALDGTGYSVSVAYGSAPNVVTQSATVTGSTFNWTPSSSLGLSVGDQITYTITDEVGNESTYTTTVQAVAHCIPVHTTGLEITELTFKPDGSGQSDVVLDTYISDAFSDRSTTSTIELAHDATPELFISGPNFVGFYYQVWVDYNQDGDFDDNGESLYASQSSQTLLPPSQVFHSWADPNLTSPLPAVPFENLADGSEYIMRIGISTTLAGAAQPCGVSSATANYQDLRIKVLNCEDPASLSMSQNSTNSTQLDIAFEYEDASIAVEYVIASGSYPFGYSGGQVDTWISSTNNATVTTTTLSGTWNSSTSKYDYAFSATIDSEGNSLSYGSRYTVAVKEATCAYATWVESNTVELVDPNGPDFATSDFAITTPANTTYQQKSAMGQFGPSPSNTLNLPVGQSLSVKTTVKKLDGSAVTPSVFYYLDLNTAFSQTATLAEKVLGTIDPTVASNLGQTALSVTNNNEVTYTTTPTSATSNWLTYTFKDLAQPGTSPSDATNAIFSGSTNSLSVAWYEAPVLNSAGDGVTGAVPGETVTLVLNGTTYTATAGNDGTVAVTSFTDGSNTLSSDAISSFVNGSYSIDQTWTSGGATYSHTNPTQVLSRLAINAAPNSVSGTAAPGATVTLTIGDETFTTTADATTGIYDFAGTTSSTTSPSTGVAFSTLVPFTATTAYTINQSMSGYTSAADVTGSILAATSDISVPSISGALALTNSCFTTIAGTGEAGSLIHLYDDQGNQLFDANGEPLTTTIEFPAPSSIFQEDWESGTSGWTIDNLDNSTTWQSTSVTGASSGTTAMYMNSYGYYDAMPMTPFGARDALISPAIDFSNYSSVSMSFEYASAWLTMPWGQPEGDSLWVYVSDDNGTTWDKVAEYDAKDQSFSTGGDVTSSGFTPSSASDWCYGSSSVTCPTINLNTYAGLSGILVKFVNVSRNAQNFYLDNISITGQPLNAQGTYSTTVDLCNAQVSTGSNTFASAYTSPYTGAVIQVGSTDTDGNTAPLSAAFVNPSVYTSSGTWTDASGTSISAPSTSGAATSSSPVIRYESNATLPSGITGLSGIEVASGATLTVPTDGCLDIAGSIAIQGTGSISLGAVMNSGGTDVESAQLKFTGEYLGPPTLEMNGQLFKNAHTIGSPMKEGFVSSVQGDETKLIGYDAYTNGTYYSAGEAIATQGLGFYAIVGSNQFIAQAGGFDVIGSPMSSLDMSLGYVSDNVSSAGSGWNMIANPYTCGWDWGNSALNDVAGTFYIYDVSSGSWTFWNSVTGTGTGLTSDVIPPLQGIWVQATSANATVSSTMSAAGELTCASGSSQNGFLKTANSIYKLTTTAVGDSSDYSEMYLVNIAGAKDGFDAAYDAWHMNGHLSRGKLYNLVGEEEMVSNALEIDSSKVLDLAFDSDNFGITYELNLLTSNADSTLKVVLEDRYEGTFWSMENGAYIFVHTQAPIGMKQTRFVLHYYQEGANVVGEDELDEEAGITVAGTTITVTNPEAYGEYQVYDASGRLITKGAVVETIMLPADNWKAGIYRLVFVGEQITIISIAIIK